MDISVIICTYNRAESLPKTFQTLAAMDVPPGLSWELIVVNNNSSDSTEAVVAGFQAKAQFPVKYLFQGRQGKSHALNAGIQAAEGEFVAFTDDDCIVHKHWLKSLKRSLEAS